MSLSRALRNAYVQSPRVPALRLSTVTGTVSISPPRQSVLSSSCSAARDGQESRRRQRNLSGDAILWCCVVSSGAAAAACSQGDRDSKVATCESQQPMPEPSYEELLTRLQRLPEQQRRAALSIMGLSIGDATGLPFELRWGTKARARFDNQPQQHERMALARQLVLQGAASGYSVGSYDGRRRAGTEYARTYSDDTTCCDIKMQAVAQASWILADKQRREGALEGLPADEDEATFILQRATLQQYLRWAHSNPLQPDGRGPLFQGYGAFTVDFLHPKNNNAIARALPGGNYFTNDDTFGAFWPTKEYVAFAQGHFRGDYGFPSWGNGAVMSFAPHPVLATRWRSTWAADELKRAAEVMSKSHQADIAELGAKLLWGLLDSIYNEAVASTAQLPSVVLQTPAWKEVASFEHDCIPVAAFAEWLQDGDCSVKTAEAFIQRLVGPGVKEFKPGEKGVFGALLRLLANWDNDHQMCLRRPGSKEPVMFSQRGLNSVIIAIWASTGATKVEDMLDRVIYVGGDADTVGAVAGQVACPLLEPAAVLQAVKDYVGLGEDIDQGPLRAATAAARRYARRAIQFAAEDYHSLRRHPSLLDADYVGI